jgi:feruloyl esterase
VPGISHCGGGDGTSTFYMLIAIDAWVGSGKAPESISVSRVRGGKVESGMGTRIMRQISPVP